MSIYENIAQANPDGCYMVLHKYGYANSEVNSISDLAYVCQTMVACEGEKSFKDLLLLHPDRDVIIEDYKDSQPKESKELFGCDGSANCNCQKSKNATGDAPSTGLANQTNTVILLGAVFVAVAILASK